MNQDAGQDGAGADAHVKCREDSTESAAPAPLVHPPHDVGGERRMAVAISEPEDRGGESHRPRGGGKTQEGETKRNHGHKRAKHADVPEPVEEGGQNRPREEGRERHRGQKDLTWRDPSRVGGQGGERSDRAEREGVEEQSKRQPEDAEVERILEFAGGGPARGAQVTLVNRPGNEPHDHVHRRHGEAQGQPAVLVYGEADGRRDGHGQQGRHPPIAEALGAPGRGYHAGHVSR